MSRDRHPRLARRRTARGLTLVELVVTIALTGIVAVVGSRMLAGLASGQREGVDRLAAAGAADMAVRRLTRELEAALPNSVRVARATVSGREAVFVEFLPVLDGGRFRAAADVTPAGPGDPLDTAAADDAGFDVIGPPLAAGLGGAQLVIHNLGDDLSDAWRGDNRRGGVTVSADGRRVGFTPAGPFPAATDTRRFFLVDGAVSFACEPVTGADGRPTWQLVRRWGYGIPAVQPTDPSAAPLAGASAALMLDGLAACDITHSQAMADLGVVTLRLALRDAGGSGGHGGTLLVQALMDNTP